MVPIRFEIGNPPDTTRHGFDTTHKIVARQVLCAHGVFTRVDIDPALNQRADTVDVVRISSEVLHATGVRHERDSIMVDSFVCEQIRDVCNGFRSSHGLIA